MTGARPCYVHVGLPKTGTSYLQGILRASDDELARQGLDLLPRGRRDSRYLHVELSGTLDPAMDPPAAFGVLDRLAEEARTAPGTRALVSKEVLGQATGAEVERLLRCLPGMEPHLVLTVRDLSRTLPSAWQQHVQGRGTVPFEEFRRMFAEHRHDPGFPFRRHVLQSVLATWGEHIPPERTHVVTVPRPGSDPTLLLHRFCEVLGLDPGPLAVHRTFDNASLGATQAELLRRVNLALGDRLPHRRAGYLRHGRDYLARRVLVRQPGPPPRLATADRGWCSEAAEEVVDLLSRGGYRIVGDLDELRPDPDAFVDRPELFAEAPLVDAAAEALATVLEDRARSGRPRRRRRPAPAHQPPPDRPGGLDRLVRAGRRTAVRARDRVAGWREQGRSRP